MDWYFGHIPKMIDKKSFKKTIATQLESANFVKKGQSWYFNGRDTIIVINLQKNDWNEEFFFNIRNLSN